MVVHEIKAPARVGSRRGWRRGARPLRTFAAFALAHGQPLLAVEPLRLLAVHDVPLPAQQRVQPTIAKTPTLLRQLPQPFAQRRVSEPAPGVARARTVEPHDPARPPLAHAMDRHGLRDRLPLGKRRSQATRLSGGVA